MSLKGRFPFRVGTTSYIVPADILPNVRFLADKVDDVELVLFESDEISNLPSPETVRELDGIASDHDLTYTVHLPLDTYLGHADEDVRRRSVEKCLRIFDCARDLDPFAYIVHFHGERRGKTPTDDLPRWLENHRASMAELNAAAGGVPLCIETLDYPFALLDDVVMRDGWPVCLDVGHLVHNGYDVAAHLDRYLRATRVVHLHGVLEGRDHRDLSGLEPVLLEDLFRRLCDEAPHERVLTMEIFGQEDFERSVEVLRRYAPCLG